MTHLAALCISFLLQSPDPVTPAGGFPIHEVHDSVVPLSDGATTNADVRLPAVTPNACGWPVVVIIHGLFGSKESVASMAQDFAHWGYVTVTYDVRGHATSTGAHTYFGLRERLDMAEVVYWAL